MHTEKYKAKNLGLLDEASRDKYISKDTEQYDCTSHSKIDFERTHYNVNLCPHDEYSHEYVKDLNKMWRGQSKSLRKLEDDDNIFFMTVLTLPKDFLPELEGLDGKELTEYIMNHPEVKAQVEEFFEEGYEALKKIYNLDDLDVISAYVHYDEETPHLHFTAIPHVHAQEEEKEADPETLRLYELSSTDPIRYCEEQKKNYQEKAEKTKENIDKAYAKGDIKRAEKLKKSYEKRLSDIAKLDKADPIKYAAKHRSKYKSQISAQKGKRETVSYEKVVPLSVYNNQHNIMQDILSKHFGRHIGILNGKTLGFDVQKLTAEEKEKLLQAAREIEQMEAEKLQAEAETAFSKAEASQLANMADDEARRYANLSIQNTNLSTQNAEAETRLKNTENELENINNDINTQTLENACLRAEKRSLQAENNNVQSETQKMQEVQNNIRANLTAFTNDYYTNEYQKAANRGDRQAANDIMNTVFQRSALCDQYKAENERLSHFNNKLTKECTENQIFRESLKEEVKTEDEILKMIDDDTISNAELSAAIKMYAILKNDGNTDSIVKVCTALDKVQTYCDKSCKQQINALKKDTEKEEKLIDVSFDFAEYDARIRGMLKKSLKYEGRTEIYQQNELKNLWADVQRNNNRFWTKYQEKRTIPDEVINLNDVFKTLIPKVIQSAISAIKSCIEQWKNMYDNQYENEYE